MEKSQISTHLRIFANNYVSFFLVHDSLTSDLFLFEGGKLCNYLATNQLCTLAISEKKRDRFLGSWFIERVFRFCESLNLRG